MQTSDRVIGVANLLLLLGLGFIPSLPFATVIGGQIIVFVLLFLILFLMYLGVRNAIRYWGGGGAGLRFYDHLLLLAGMLNVVLFVGGLAYVLFLA